MGIERQSAARSASPGGAYKSEILFARSAVSAPQISVKPKDQSSLTAAENRDLDRRAAAEAEQSADSANEPPAAPRSDLPEGFRRNGKTGDIEYWVPGKDGYEVKNSKGEVTKTVPPVSENWEKLCSPIEIVAQARPPGDNHWGLLVCVEDPDGNWHDVIIGMDELLGDGNEPIQRLARHGLKLAAGRAGRAMLRQLLEKANPEQRARFVSSVGWHGGSFVLPDESFGGDSAELYLFRPSDDGAAPENPFVTKGDLEEWRAHVAAPAVGNSRVIFAIAIAFAGPLARLLGAEGGGYHFRGDSSSGKTTCGKAAGSVWGSRSPRLGFGVTWEATANGIEGMARAHSDTFQLLDELGQADPQVAARTAYQLANGSEKIRGARQGGARATGSWVLLFMSTGEISLADKVAEVGKRAKAGQQVRILDLPADAGAGHGAFEKLHRFNSGKELAEHLDRAAGSYYGHAGRYFLRELMRCDQHEFVVLAERYMKAFETECGAAGDSGQIGRAARRFALVAFAGEMATRWGITSWPKGEARNAAKRMFGDWVEARGGRGSHESMDALEFIRGLVERYSGSRFAPWGSTTAQSSELLGVVKRSECPHVPRCAECSHEPLTFYILPPALKEECRRAQQSLLHITDALVSIGALRPGDGNNRARQSCVPNFPSSQRWYEVDARKLLSDSSKPAEAVQK
jgi:putative DNA primase/helicase